MASMEGAVEGLAHAVSDNEAGLASVEAMLEGHV